MRVRVRLERKHVQKLIFIGHFQNDFRDKTLSDCEAIKNFDDGNIFAGFLHSVPSSREVERMRFLMIEAFCFLTFK